MSFKYLQNYHVKVALRVVSALIDAFLLVIGLVSFAEWDAQDIYVFSASACATIIYITMGLLGVLFETCVGAKTMVTYLILTIFDILVGFCILGAPSGTKTSGVLWEIFCVLAGFVMWSVACAHLVSVCTTNHDLSEIQDEFESLFSPQRYSPIGPDTVRYCLSSESQVGDVSKTYECAEEEGKSLVIGRQPLEKPGGGGSMSSSSSASVNLAG